MMVTEKKADKALVSVFEDLETAIEAVHALQGAGFATDKMELINQNVAAELPDVQTPKTHETTATTLLGSAEKWGALGAGAGATAGILAAIATGFPGIGLGMIFMGGVTGAIVGGMAGAAGAVEDDSVNLPTLADYEKELEDGRTVVVVHGSHEQMMNAREVISELPFAHQHLHLIHGHEFHEHPDRS
jgi:hypothetical protein